MKELTIDLKKWQTVIGQCTYTQYDTVYEAIKHLEHSVVLDLINRQAKTDAMNKARTEIYARSESFEETQK